ncbi:universal stress protein [Dongshaea marina]|uniref:universal stress protein n=1 Tax=Dongshaea marina TaxID=2047966 RepID=UPI000D3E936B|nr:universal stress protein [Dongshaea marina]
MEGHHYQHILVAIDLAEDNRKVIDKAIDRAKANQAKLSIIHVDVDLKDLYTEMIDIDIDNVQNQVIEESMGKLEEFLAQIEFPINKKLVVCGDLCERICQAVENYEVDLMVCGHRQSFWSLLTSSARQLMNTVPCDLLVVPLDK